MDIDIKLKRKSIMASDIIKFPAGDVHVRCISFVELLDDGSLKINADVGMNEKTAELESFLKANKDIEEV